MRIAQLAGREETPALEERLAKLDPSAPSDYREIAALLASEWSLDPPTFVGLSGGQGAGKSTLSRLIAAACEDAGLRTCVLSLDDFYYPLSARRRLASEIHPLLETRGPPGTHDLIECRDAMRALRQDEAVLLPVFDKGLDDRKMKRLVRGPFDLVLLEGWCVGAVPESESGLDPAMNSLEEEEDQDGVWRRYVNAQLAGIYGEVGQMLDYLIFLRVPDLVAVRRWRLEQEMERTPKQRHDREAIDRFVQYFERTTRSMDQTVPGRADLVVGLSSDHSVFGVTFVSTPKTT
ncbi:MAG: hypothetical protein ABGX04_03915 [Myxococcales bacterium]|nr:kinase [Myxococcales bacterium]HIK84624.1 kinase [Myxococcales bacterium]